MGLERMKCCGALTRVYSDAGRRIHHPLCRVGQAESDYAELTDNDLPYHLRPDALPLAQCSRCGRQTWSTSEVGTEDCMTQPDGQPCGGRFG